MPKKGRCHTQGRNDTLPHDIVAFFNGVRIGIDDVNKKEVHRESSHKVWNDWNDEDEMLDITPEYRWGIY